MTTPISRKAEKAGEDTAKVAKEKTDRIRTRVETDEDFRRKLIIGGVSALGAVALGVGGYVIFKRRDDIKKSLKDARDTIKEKIEHHGTKPGPAGGATGGTQH
ncbi:hypothetical protein VOLCADRAFT_99302 [Volvox carteri f. nagariensis]|uniref:Uncharacterized protein n=1 Tax=Volvox carteri f. nagariensis TaxID=3068 RepID=D8UHG7_VOLCA|nr:uncharacterized protein VOLCADRAFT_99302 [Volvox carteri f. nagariensis]EFJ40849.1 hypothetical protein VOLCADRAFT_99302 [Volvox carteri f. nagariensis]|eukprot:XP_002958118.1 hypothetical protein VOLCADRAFT_99302 [Volvox carteri f. nagariensis]